jgi:hypothetical protein
VHGSNAAVRKNGEADLRDALLVKGWTGLFRNERDPGVVDLADDLFEVRVEVDAHGVGEDVNASFDSVMCDGDVGTIVAALTAILGGLLGSLADGFTGGLGLAAEIGAGGSWLRRVHDGLLRRMLGERLRSGGLLCLLGRSLGGSLLGWLGRRRRCGGSRGFGFTHSLKLFEGLLVEGRLDGLLGAVLVADDVGGLLGKLLAHVLRHVEVGELLVAFFEDVGRIDEAGLVEDDLRAIEHKPADSEPDDDRDVDGFAEAGLGALVIKRVEEVNQLMLFEVAIAVGTHRDGRFAGRLSGVRRSFERGHELCCCDGCGTRKLRWQLRKRPGWRDGAVPGYVVHIIFSSLRAKTVKDRMGGCRWTTYTE